MTRKQKILSVLLGAILVLSVVAATYAYFTASVNRTGNTGIVEVTTTELDTFKFGAHAIMEGICHNLQKETMESQSLICKHRIIYRR